MMLVFMLNYALYHCVVFTHYYLVLFFSKAGDEAVNAPKRIKIFAGGFESYEEYTYIRGRGMGSFSVAVNIYEN